MFRLGTECLDYREKMRLQKQVYVVDQWDYVIT